MAGSGFNPDILAIPSTLNHNAIQPYPHTQNNLILLSIEEGVKEHEFGRQRMYAGGFFVPS